MSRSCVLNLWLAFSSAALWHLVHRRSGGEPRLWWKYTGAESLDGKESVMKPDVTLIYFIYFLYTEDVGHRSPERKNWCCFLNGFWKTAGPTGLRCVEGPDLWPEPAVDWGAEGRERNMMSALNLDYVTISRAMCEDTRRGKRSFIYYRITGHGLSGVVIYLVGLVLSLSTVRLHGQTDQVLSQSFLWFAQQHQSLSFTDTTL